MIIFFFFQAEDGIRDIGVTGVQTCALPILLHLAEYGLRRQVLVFPIVGFQIVSSIYFQAVGKPKLSFLISMSRQILVLIPCLFLLSSLWGLDGVWYASPLSDFIATIVTFILIKRELKHLEYLKLEKEREETEE